MGCKKLPYHLNEELRLLRENFLKVVKGNCPLQKKSGLNYYPFGSVMPGRQFSSNSYRYGFQGQEKDDEIKGAGNSVNFKFRMHDPRLGRFFSVDPLTSKYPWNSPYAFAENDVIRSIDLEGLERFIAIVPENGGDTKLEVVPYQDIYGKSNGPMGKGTAYFSRSDAGKYSFLQYAPPKTKADAAQIFSNALGAAETSSDFIKDDYMKGQLGGIFKIMSGSIKFGQFLDRMERYNAESDKFFPDKDLQNELAGDMVQMVISEGAGKLFGRIPFFGDAVDIILTDSRKEDGVTNTKNLYENYSVMNRSIKAYQNTYFNTNHDTSTRQSRIEDAGKSMECDLENACE